MADYSGVDLWTCDLPGCTQRVKFKGQAFCPDHTSPPQPELKPRTPIFRVRGKVLHCTLCGTEEALVKHEDWLRTAEIHHRMFHTIRGRMAIHRTLADFGTKGKHVCTSHCYEHFYEGDI